jgi:hypothetical protein
MCLDFLKPLRKCALQGFIILLMGYAEATVAKTPDKMPGKALTELLINDNEGSEFQLEVRQMPLAQVFDSIALKTHVPIHYSALPEGLVTATCVGTTLVKVLECLLDRKADLIVRYPRNVDKSENKRQLAEAWVLGSRLNGHSKLQRVVRQMFLDKRRIREKKTRNLALVLPPHLTIKARLIPKLSPIESTSYCKWRSQKTQQTGQTLLGNYLQKKPRTILQ